MGISTFTSKEFAPFFAGYLSDWQWAWEHWIEDTLFLSSRINESTK
jgi:hypothetical protein